MELVERLNTGIAKGRAGSAVVSIVESVVPNVPMTLRYRAPRAVPVKRAWAKGPPSRRERERECVSVRE